MSDNIDCFAFSWEAQVDKSELAEAIGFVRTRAGLKYKGSKLEPEVMIVAAPGGLSLRTSLLASDIQASGAWDSPIVVHGPSLRRLVPKLTGPEIVLRYERGKLYINSTSIPAREI